MKKVMLAISLFLISMFYVFFVNAYAEGAEVKEKTVTPDRLEFDIAIETATQQYTTGTVTTEDGLIFDTSTGTITGYTSESATSIIIPNQINGITVKAIGDSAFSDCIGLKEITIPDSVTSIGDWAFYYCINLTGITIPDSVTSIGDGAFSNCSGLKEITIPDGVTSIGDWAFYYCISLKEITIPNSITSIGNHVFNYCKNLMEITVPNNVISIGNYAFANCNLTKMTIPDSVTSIGDWAFYYCSNLTQIEIPNSVTYIGDGVFSYCSNLTEITIPDSVTSIGQQTFFYCGSLTKITIPNSITSIGYYAFASCGLKEITIPDSVTSIAIGAFDDCYNLTEIIIPDSVISIDKNAFVYCGNIESVYCYKGSTADNKALYPNPNVKIYYLDEISDIDFIVKDTEGRAGEEVDVYVSVNNNSGLAVYDLKVNFDKTKVTPVSITQINSDEISGGLVSNLRKPSVSAESLDFVTAVWSNASNVTYNGDLFKIRFKIKEDVLYSEVPITLEFNEDGLLDENYETLTPSITNGKITVYPPYEFGDINMDGKINARDLLMLTQYLAEYNNITFNSSQLYLADVYKDGTIDLLDLLLLKQYLAGWDVVLGQTIAQSISLFSDDSINLDLNSEYISDDEIKINVLAKDNPGIAAFKLKLNYDNTALTPVSLTKGTAVTGSITTNINSLNENSNYVTALWSDVVNSNSDGVLYSVIFKVKDNSSTNTKLSVTCSEKDIINENFMNISSNQAEIELQTDNQ